MSDTYNNESVSISSEIAETVIGVNTRFKGTVTTDKPIRIDGYFEGTIDSSSRIEVSETGKFNGTISCREMQLTGSGEGTVTCSELIRFASIGVFKGTLNTKNLVIVEGSVFDGEINMSALQNK